jgi:beta-glucosidase-like glycosyl hydrolase/CubicO group peptidase (beta-lactamase class C family)
MSKSQALCLLFAVCLVCSPAFSSAQSWVDTTLSQLTLSEKVGQLFMMPAYSNRDEQDYQYLESIVKKHQLGGLIFMQGDPVSQVRLINRYQRVSKVPLLIAQDAEWGLDMRLDDSPSYPKNMTLGAIADDSLLYAMGQAMASDLLRVGVTLNFAPVVDVNNNPRNPVINIRSFGENKFNVARKGLMLTQGMQDHGVMACAKHFPGHGDTDVDSHLGLPVITHSAARIDTLELYPFAKMIDGGVGSAMVAHLYIPALDPTPNQATTLSPLVVQGLLREKMGFKGLIITDALNMQGVAKYYSNGEAAYRAFLAGNDILLFPDNIPRAKQMIMDAVEAGTISQEDLDERVRRILVAKYQLGLHQATSLSLLNMHEDLFDVEGEALTKRLYEASTTLAQNRDRLIPLDRLEERRIAYVQIGGGSGNSFDQTIKKYARVDNFYLRPSFTAGEKAQMLDKLKPYDTVIMGVFGMKKTAQDRFGISAMTEQFSAELEAAGHQTILTLFGSAYALAYFGEEDAILVAYEPEPFAQVAAAQAIFGGQPVTGTLPVTASPQFPEGTGVIIHKAIRFGFALPEEVGMNRWVLNRIDSIADEYIAQHAMPGCEVLVMRGHRIVYARGFGRTEYEGGMPIDPYYHTYDLASITKVAATTLCAMYLVDQKKLDLDVPLHQYLPDLKGTKLAYLTPRRLLLHNAGLPGWLAVHHETYTDFRRGLLNKRFYSTVPARDEEQITITPSLYGTAALGHLYETRLKQTDVKSSARVRYSDVGMTLMGRVVEASSGYSLDRLAAGLFYRPMGMNRTTFTPYRYGLAYACPPTEQDDRWRKTKVMGYVHDPAAAVLNGVAGHAGLFSNAYDLAKLGLMLKNGGTYGYQRFFSDETVDDFTRRQLRYSRRGLGWDKPEPGRDNRNPVSDFASDQTFGHTGFTGTCLWVDPTYDLVFIFLSNRTYPNVGNTLLQHAHVREKMMDEVYRSIFAYQGKDIRQDNP